MRKSGGVASVAIASITLFGCAPVMEVMRPDPVDIHRFVLGEKRLHVLAELGNPSATVPDGQKSCDIYKLFTHGPDSVGKGVIAAGEAATDVLTVGLSEVLWTPVEAATRNSKHTVLFCYDQEGRLLSTDESDSHLN
jgi:hypothetical protein